MNDKTVKDFCTKVKKELFENIIPFWIDRTQDNQNGGYYGKISNDLKIIADAPKSLILNSRILWTFAHLYQFKRESKFFHMAERAYHFLINHFWDHEMGGVYWLVDYKGNAIDNRKKIYGQAFTIYALAEYYRASGDRQVLEQAIKIYELIEKNNYDKENGGYFEASNRDWTLADDLRLSALDMN
jgi:mannobiose 2-epimerase